MKRIVTSLVALSAAYAVAQTCVVAAPAASPAPTQLIVYLPGDAGTTGCTVRAVVPGGANGSLYPVGNAKCAQAAAIALQAAANDNGWNDGGAP